MCMRVCVCEQACICSKRSTKAATWLSKYLLIWLVKAFHLISLHVHLFSYSLLSPSLTHTQICNIVPMSRLMSQLTHIEVDLPTIFTHMHNDDLPSLYTFIRTFNIPSLNSNALAFIIIPLSFLLLFFLPIHRISSQLVFQNPLFSWCWKSTFQQQLSRYRKVAKELLLSCWAGRTWERSKEWDGKKENEESGAYCCDFPALLLDKRPAVSLLDSSK